MPFGYIPHKTPWKDAILKMIGNPSMISFGSKKQKGYSVIIKARKK